VMLLFEEDPDVLHPSLRTSMEEIYRIRDGNKSSDNRPTLQQQSGNESVERWWETNGDNPKRKIRL